MSTETYDDGYETGLKWKESYRPGGPWVMYPRPGDTGEHRERCEASVENARDWFKGFDDGSAMIRLGSV